MGRWFLCVAGILLVLVVPLAPDGLFSTVSSVNAQPDPENVTVPQRDAILSVSVLPESTYAEIPAGGNVRYTLKGEDHRFQGVGLAGGSIQVKCRTTPVDEDTLGWSVNQPGIRLLSGNGDTFETDFQVSTLSRPRPDLFVVDVQCVGLGAMGGAVISEFQIGTRVEPYSFMQIRSSDVPSTQPNENFQTMFTIDNRGNRDKLFHGEIKAPPGWDLAYPATVWVPAGGSKDVVISGVAPNDKLYYRYETGLMEVKYWPEDNEGMAQTRSIPATVNGFYLHPALMPLILLGTLAIVMAVFLIVYARRTVEEQVLGKPIPPWRIPIERQSLKRLEREDPDEFYIVRYHLMEEEHQSALLWYRHYKHATRKDRKLERKYLKKANKVEGRVERLNNRQKSLKKRVARRLRVLPARRRRRLAAMEQKALSLQWKEQRGLLKIHKKSVRRIDKLHADKSKKNEKRVAAVFEKEYKKAEKENKKRIKQGLDPLPVPEEPKSETPPPEFPSVVEVPIQGAADSRLTVKFERLNARFNRRIVKRSRRAKRKMDKKASKADQKEVRFKNQIPVRPSTHLYDEDNFVPEHEVVVEDSRPVVNRMLNLPTLEEGDELRRRRSVYRVKIKEASRQEDDREVERLKGQWQEEKSRLRARKGNHGTGPGAPKGSGAPKSDHEGDFEGSEPHQASGGRFAGLSHKLRNKKPREKNNESAGAEEPKRDKEPPS